MIDIKDRLIRHSEYRFITDKLYLKYVFNLKMELVSELPCHWIFDLVLRREEGGRILGRSFLSNSIIRLSCSQLSQDSL